MHEPFIFRKNVPNSPRIITSGPGVGQLTTSMAVTGTSPKGVVVNSALMNPRPLAANAGPAGPGGRPMLQYNAGDYGLHQQPVTGQPQVQPQPSTTVSQPASTVSGGASSVVTATNTAQVASNPLPLHETVRRYIANGTSKFFGVNGEDANEKVWIERRRRIAIKLFGGVKDDYHMDGNGHGGTSTYDDPLFNEGNGARLRYDPLASEMVEGKMVLKILKPPRNKDSLSSLTGQSLAWVFNVSRPPYITRTRSRGFSFLCSR